jgi:hypothetical protein
MLDCLTESPPFWTGHPSLFHFHPEQRAYLLEGPSLGSRTSFDGQRRRPDLSKGPAGAPFYGEAQLPNVPLHRGSTHADAKLCSVSMTHLFRDQRGFGKKNRADESISVSSNLPRDAKTAHLTWLYASGRDPVKWEAGRMLRDS